MSFVTRRAPWFGCIVAALCACSETSSRAGDRSGGAYFPAPNQLQSLAGTWAADGTDFWIITTDASGGVLVTVPAAEGIRFEYEPVDHGEEKLSLVVRSYFVGKEHPFNGVPVEFTLTLEDGALRSDAKGEYPGMASSFMLHRR